MIKKLESNNVGVDAHIDPQTKHKQKTKLTSNIVGAYCMRPEGITLVALVITIIVLLILAGVALSMVMGDSGIFAKARNAKEQTLKSQAQEDINLRILETKLAKNGNTATLVDLKETLSTSTEKYIIALPGTATIVEGAELAVTTSTEYIYVTNTAYNQRIKVNQDLSIDPIITAATGGSSSGSGTGSETGGSGAGETGGGETLSATGVTITYDINYEGGSYAAIASAEVGKSIAIVIPKRENYVFTGWYTASTGGTKRNYTTMPEESETLYAGWASPIPNTSMVGKYADIDGNGTVDGIIVVDLLAQSGQSGYWNPSDNSGFTSEGAYTIPITTSSGLKKYYVSKTENADSKFGNKDVIVPEEGTTGSDRFYVLQLSDVTYSTDNKMYWYYRANGNMESTPTATSDDFGTGRTNTTTMMNKYGKTTANGGYGAENAKDMWKNISTQVSDGWFVPSRGEWAAFGASFGVDRTNYNSTYGFSHWYWTSSQSSASAAYEVMFNNGMINTNNVVSGVFVRLATTF